MWQENGMVSIVCLVLVCRSLCLSDINNVHCILICFQNTCVVSTVPLLNEFTCKLYFSFELCCGHTTYAIDQRSARIHYVRPIREFHSELLEAISNML